MDGFPWIDSWLAAGAMHTRAARHDDRYPARRTLSNQLQFPQFAEPPLNPSPPSPATQQRPSDAAIAASVLTGRGWLAAQPEAFQQLVLAHASVQAYRAGDVVYRFGDDLGGIYGVVSGAYKATTAPPTSTPRLLHVGMPGSWVGEGCYLVRERRRIGVSAPVDSLLVHVPLQAMDEITARDPTATRRFTQILMGNVDTLVRAFYDLQNPRAERRVALALLRIAGADGDPVPLSQEELGVMSNTVRRQVNAALQRFASEGWVRTAYRVTVITDAAALRRYAAES